MLKNRKLVKIAHLMATAAAQVGAAARTRFIAARIVPVRLSSKGEMGTLTLQKR